MIVPLLLLLPNFSALKSEPFHMGQQVQQEQVSEQELSAGYTYFFTHDSLLDTERALTAPTIIWNKYASRAVKDVLKREGEALDKVSKRSDRYFQTIEKVFAQYNLPAQLKYLAVVESQLRTTAPSRVGAKGVWQFMPTTARELGLKVQGKTDERTHFYKSTVAAAKYIRSLHGMFNDWLLVLAAYNSGPGPVLSAIKKSGSRNFWVLQRFLPAESRAHVKRFIATHYYFEQEGSVTILTRNEALAYEKATREYLASIAAASGTEKEKEMAPEVATITD
ncbi:MAG TPA: lytic transglycosylase domain-containing protein [Flavisolibacter sp.]